MADANARYWRRAGWAGGFGGYAGPGVGTLELNTYFVADGNCAGLERRAADADAKSHLRRQAWCFQ